MANPRVLIEIAAGKVQCVVVDEPCMVHVVDYDLLEASNGNPSEETWYHNTVVKPAEVDEALAGWKKSVKELKNEQTGG